jgi:hypothetical protein
MEPTLVGLVVPHTLEALMGVYFWWYLLYDLIMLSYFTINFDYETFKNNVCMFNAIL